MTPSSKRKTKKNYARTRPAVPLLSGIENRIKNYVLAASAGCVFMAHPLSAEVLYTKADAQLSHGKVQLDFDHNGTTDAFLTEQFFFPNASMLPLVAVLKLTVGGSTGAGVIVTRQEAAVLNSGDEIGSSRAFQPVYPNKVLLARASEVYNGSTGTCCNFFYGNWRQETGKYLGLKLSINGQVHYGWARLTVQSCCTSLTPRILVHLTGYAYETDPGVQIAAGQTTGSLGSLAAGARALPAEKLAKP